MKKKAKIGSSNGVGATAAAAGLNSREMRYVTVGIEMGKRRKKGRTRARTIACVGSER